MKCYGINYVKSFKRIILNQIEKAEYIKFN